MDRCQYLDYRTGDEFDGERAYCAVVDRFVQPVRADVCNARYDLSPDDHCEYYREREGLEDNWMPPTGELGSEKQESTTDGDG